MRLRELAEALDLCELTPPACVDQEITRGYASDLLSDIMAHAPAGGVLVTFNVDSNVITVASLSGLGAIIFSCGGIPDDKTIARAAGEDLSLFVSEADAFEIVGRLYEVGIRGNMHARRALGSGSTRTRGRVSREWELRRPSFTPCPGEVAQFRLGDLRCTGEKEAAHS